MAAPNLKNLTVITAHSVQATLTNVPTVVYLTNPALSNQVFLVTSIIVANKTAGTVTVTAGFVKALGVLKTIATNISIPSGASFTPIDKLSMTYMEEGDVFEAGASANASLDITINYFLLS